MHWVPYFFLGIPLLTSLTLRVAFLCEIELLLLSRSALSFLINNHWVKVFLTFVENFIVCLTFLGTELTQVPWGFLAILNCVDLPEVDKFKLGRWRILSFS